MRQLRLPRASSRPLRFPRSRVLPPLPLLRSQPPQGAGRLRPDVGQPVSSSSGFRSAERGGSPQLPWIPRCALPRSQMPGPASTHMARTAPRPRLTACVRVLSNPPYTNRKARTTIELSGFYNAALTLAVYASCGPCGRATQYSLPSGCQPFSGGIDYPPGYRCHVSRSYLHWLLSSPRPGELARRVVRGPLTPLNLHPTVEPLMDVDSH